MSLEWETWVVVLLFKKKDQMVYFNYRGNTIHSLPGKVYAKVLEKRNHLLVKLQIQEEQWDFYPGHGILDHLYALARLPSGARDFAQPAQMSFVDLEKAYNHVFYTSKMLHAKSQMLVLLLKCPRRKTGKELNFSVQLIAQIISCCLCIMESLNFLCCGSGSIANASVLPSQWHFACWFALSASGSSVWSAPISDPLCCHTQCFGRPPVLVAVSRVPAGSYWAHWTHLPHTWWFPTWIQSGRHPVEDTSSRYINS